MANLEIQIDFMQQFPYFDVLIIEKAFSFRTLLSCLIKYYNTYYMT